LTLAVFFMSLAGIPPLAGWFAKFAMFSATISVGSWWGYSIAIVAALNAVVALVYYLNVLKSTFFDTVPADLDVATLEGKEIPGPTSFAIGITAVAVIVLGIFPGIAANLGNFSSDFLAAIGL
jgi:NADH-quinone oxidoreductase subunit N